MNTVRIPLSKSPRFAVIDVEDAPIVLTRKWHEFRCDNAVYAASNKPIIIGGISYTLMHRLILRAKPGMDVDHRDRDGLDNRRSQLRCCSRQQNNWNSIPRAGTSAYKGVSWHKEKHTWRAFIKNPGTRRFQHLGYFRVELDAARAYDEAAVRYFGEFARLNLAGLRGDQ
ncbi:MAG: HNH endonuclease [Bryobacteraceae bacterium]|jgi:hypothetical protein